MIVAGENGTGTVSITNGSVVSTQAVVLGNQTVGKGSLM